MIFVVIATMVKEIYLDNHVRASCLTVLNARSQQDAKGQFLESADVVDHIQDNWKIGPIDTMELSFDGLLQDADFLKHVREKFAQPPESTESSGEESEKK